MDAVYQQLSTFFKQPVERSCFSSVGGGSINQTYRLILPDKKRFFCKINSATKFPHLFQREKEGLALIRKQAIVKTPEVVHHFITNDEQVLVLQWIEPGERNNDFWTKFGAQLAALHHVSSHFFGLDENNYMGSVQQINSPVDNWIRFFIDNRLQPLVQQCQPAQLLSKEHIGKFEKLYTRLQELFPQEVSALVHGDLWSGNFMCDELSEPVLIDPAVYFGHRSVDLAMTTLFGGFNKHFYEAYNHHFPLPHKYKEQWEVCNLYPLLIHLLLFGKSYLNQIEAILKRYH